MDNVRQIGLPANPAGVRLDDPDLTQEDLDRAVEYLTT